MPLSNVLAKRENGENGVHAYMRFLSISSNPFTFSICSPRLEQRLAAGWLTFDPPDDDMVQHPWRIYSCFPWHVC